jgi:hypothetical protein
MSAYCLLEYGPIIFCGHLTSTLSPAYIFIGLSAHEINTNIYGCTGKRWSLGVNTNNYGGIRRWWSLHDFFVSPLADIFIGRLSQKLNTNIHGYRGKQAAEFVIEGRGGTPVKHQGKCRGCFHYGPRCLLQGSSTATPTLYWTIQVMVLVLP